MKKLIITTFVLTLAFSVTPVVFAETTAQDAKQNVRDAKQALKDAKQNDKLMMREMKASNSADKNNRAGLKNVELTAINGTTLTVTKDGKTYTVTTDTKTVFRRHFGGKSSLTEFSVGNMLDVRGTFTDEAKTVISARSIRNRSVMKFRGAFIGDVVSKTGNTFVIKSKHRGDQTVTIDATTKYVNRKQEVITLNDVVVGHRVRVKGIWDKANNTVTQVTQVKDFSLPPKATPSSPTTP